jgi:5'-deoxynucleotidase
MMALDREDVAQHTFGVVAIAHALCVIDEEVYGRQPPVADVLATALLHDASESILTDVIAPVKKYSPEVQSAFSALERVAENQLVETLPTTLQSRYRTWFHPSVPEVQDYVHAADKLDALTKCLQEVRRGNQDFSLAAKQIEQAVQSYAERMPCVRYFMDTFLPAFSHSVDEYRYLK